MRAAFGSSLRFLWVFATSSGRAEPGAEGAGNPREGEGQCDGQNGAESLRSLPGMGLAAVEAESEDQNEASQEDKGCPACRNHRSIPLS